MGSDCLPGARPATPLYPPRPSQEGQENTINYLESKGAGKTRPKVARRSSLATFSERSSKPGGRLSVLTSLCHQQSGLFPARSPRATFQPGFSPRRLMTCSLSLKGLLFIDRTPQIMLPT